jgi:hypothetical protein
LRIVAAGLMLNLLFNVMMAARGFPYPYNWFLGDPRDWLADFLKMGMSYPGDPVHRSGAPWYLQERLDQYQWQIERLRGTPLNHFHMLPLSTLMGLLIRQALSIADAGWVLVLVLGSVVALLTAVVTRAVPAGRGRIAMGVVTIIAYPVLFAIDRGHLFSLVCGTALVAGTLRSLKLGRADAVSILLFAVALNIRPNAGLIPLALFLFRRGWRFRDMVALGLATVALFLAALGTAHAIYPEYHLASWLKGLSDYSKLYIVRDFGQSFNSSLFGALRALFGFQPWAYTVPLYVALGMFLATCMLAWRNALPDVALIFLTLSAYALGSQVFGDYHLIVFLIPVVMLAAGAKVDSATTRAILVASCLMLIPKNYIFQVDDEGMLEWSWQVVINPLILLRFSVPLLWRGFRGVGGAQTEAAELPPGSPAAILTSNQA